MLRVRLADEDAEMARSLVGVAEVVAEGAETLVAGRPDEAALDSPGLQAVIVPFSGIPTVTLERLRARPHLRLYNLRFNGPIVAEMAVGLLLAAARGIPSGDAALRVGRWQGRQDDFVGVHLGGRTATVFGYGSLGRRIGAALEALGVRVLGVARHAAADAYPFEALDSCLRQSNILIVSAPSTAQTRGAIDRARIESLRPPRLLVNVGRGEIVDEQGLFEACRDGVLFGAGLDVWYTYPKNSAEPCFPSRLPFHELDNVVLSPHRGGASDRTEALRAQALVELLGALARGEPVRPVDTDAGY